MPLICNCLLYFSGLNAIQTGLSCERRSMGGGGGGLLSITLKLAKLHMIMLWSFPTSKYNFTGALRKVNDIITS